MLDRRIYVNGVDAADGLFVVRSLRGDYVVVDASRRLNDLRPEVARELGEALLAFADKLNPPNGSLGKNGAPHDKWYD